jgi:hypothetical protein
MAAGGIVYTEFFVVWITQVDLFGLLSVFICMCLSVSFLACAYIVIGFWAVEYVCK